MWMLPLYLHVNQKSDYDDIYLANDYSAEGHGFQHLPRDLANVNALKKHV